MTPQERRELWALAGQLLNAGAEGLLWASILVALILAAT